MNKETLSHYGWLVVLTLVLTVVMALATPLGTYVGDGVVAIGKQFTSTATNNANEDNIGKLENEIDGKFQGCNHVNIDVVNKSELTCTTDGNTGDKVCRKCGTVVEKGIVTKAKGHDYSHHMLFSEDQHKQVCYTCGYEHITNHNLNYTETVKSTCITPGSSDVICTDCKYEGVRPNALIPDNHEGTSIYGGTQAVHLKYSCCGVTINNSHTYTKTTEIAATCTVKGTSRYTCACGYTYTNQDIAALGHDYSKKDTSTTYRVTTATCQVLATYNYRCTRCTSKDTTRVYSAGNYASHDYSVKNTSTTYRATTATCKAAETYYYKCTWCTAKGTQTFSNGSKVAHSYTADGTTVATAATCIANKYCYKECVWCGLDSSTKYEVPNTINPSNHALDSGYYVGTYAVHSAYDCCGAPRITHDSSSTTVTYWTSYTVDSGVQYSAATCTAKRKNYYKCTCGYEPKSSSYLVEVGSALGHDYTEKTATSTYLKSAATCTSVAVYYKNCSRSGCSAKGTATFTSGSKNSSNHTGTSVYGGTSGVHTKYNCCGATISSTHSYTVDSGVQYTAATCKAARKNYKKCACGYNPQSSSYVVSTGGVNASNHTGSKVNGGTSTVHQKWNCCNATASSTHSYTTTYSGNCGNGRTPKYTCSCGYSYNGSTTTASCSFTRQCNTAHSHG